MDDPLLLVSEVAERLRTPRSTTYLLVKSGTIRSIKISGRYRVPESAVDQYINALLSRSGEAA
jgi:excisionase family DNA binding protein